MSSALAIVGTLVLAGCITGEAPPATASPQASEVAPPGGFDETSGAVRGLVTDAELQPIVSAQVAIQDVGSQAQTAQDGSFSFSHVPPGDHVIIVGALGYMSASKRITVEAGRETAGIQIQLDEIPIIEARMQTYVFEGYITCTIGAAEVLSEECGQGLQTEVGTFGTNPNNKIDWKWNYTADQTDLVGTLIEMVWQPGSAAATQLTLYVANKFHCTPSCEADGPVYCDTDNHGPPVQRCYIDDLDMKEDEMPWDMTARAWGAPVEATEVPNVVLEQKFTMYRTDFFGEMGALDYSAIPDT